jgi:hypothetical protein
LTVVEMMAFAFHDDGPLDYGLEVIIAAALAKHSLDIDLIVVKQARPQVTVGCHAKPVARRTEVLCDRADEADGTRGSREAEIARRAIALGGPAAFEMAKRI